MKGQVSEALICWRSSSVAYQRFNERFCCRVSKAPPSSNTETRHEATAVLFSAVSSCWPWRGIRGGISRAISRL